jgi:hypothetical protein
LFFALFADGPSMSNKWMPRVIDLRKAGNAVAGPDVANDAASIQL